MQNSASTAVWLRYSPLWVALGDSYTAGVIPAAGDTFEVPRDGCERTDRPYPQAIDRDLGSLFDLTNVSGGVGAPCEDAPAAGISTRLDKVSQEYDRMLAVLHERAPQAKILAVGYPTIVPKDTSKRRYNDPTQFGSITQGDLDWLRQDVLEPLNKAIEKSAGTQEAASFVDLYDSSQNHSVCDTGKWVEGFITAPDQLSFVHPNTLGHRNAANHVEEAMLNTIG